MHKKNIHNMFPKRFKHIVTIGTICCNIGINIDDTNKLYIKTLFDTCIKGVEIYSNDTLNKGKKHCGFEGHWLETKMGILHNSKNEPDIYGYEMKKQSSDKITLGDFSASEYVFSKHNKRTCLNEMNNWTEENDAKMNKTTFLRTFGNPNTNKNNRYSWSGMSVPSYNEWNLNGQLMTINSDNDIIIYYSFSKDTRPIKSLFPLFLHFDNIAIAIWKASKMKLHINNKFNQKGFFICKKLQKIQNRFEKICFGKAFDFDYFIENIKNKQIIFDSGMHEGNNRNYSHFRGRPSFWNNLFTEEYL